MRILEKMLMALGVMALSACAPQLASVPAAGSPAPAVQEQREPVTILVSIDGFRADYLERGETPTLARLAAEGVSASMIPSFPSKTFPNHWAAVTGYTPDHNGIVANSFNDPERPDPADRFAMSTTDPFYWNGKEPIWVTAEKAGIRTGVMFWPGSAVAYGGTLVPRGYGRVEGGVRPADWQAFDQNVTPEQRVNTVIDWLRRPAEIRPQLVLLYFDELDTAGHAGGPDSPEVTQALRSVEADIASLVRGLESLGQPANLVIVADHGMAQTSSERVIALDKVLDPGIYTLDENGPYATFRAVPGQEAALERQLLKPHDHMQCWRKNEIPARFGYGSNPRIPPYLCLAETGWLILPSEAREPFTGGTHGYDNQAPEMAALFIADGPAFARHAVLDRFPNVAVNPLLRRLLGLPQDGSMDGKLGSVEDAFQD